MIETPYNITFDQAELCSYTKVDDATVYMVSMVTPSLCPGIPNDKAPRTTQFTNVRLSQTTAARMVSVSAAVFCNAEIDDGKRVLKCIIENLTAENIVSQQSIFNILAHVLVARNML